MLKERKYSGGKMKKLTIVVIFALMVLANKLWACSVSVDDNAQKNLLAAHAASHLDISLVSVSKTNVEDYARTFSGEDSYECPLYLVTTARVSFKYSPRKFQNCDASVVVTRRQYMGVDIPTGPIDELEFAEANAACSTSLPRPIPVPRPIPCIPGRTCVK